MAGLTQKYYWSIFAWLSIILWIEFSADLHLACDGSHYFVSIVDQRWFTDFDWGRTHSVYLTQWLLYLSVRAGVTDISTLKLLFAGGIYSVYLLSFGCCIFAVRGEDSRLLLFPLLSIAAVNLPASFVLFGESQVSVLLSWPILLLLLRKRSWTGADKLLLCLLAFLWLRTYQASAVAALICMLVAARRYFSGKNNGEQFSIAVFLVLQFFQLFISVSGGILYPRDPENAAAFLNGNLETIVNPLFGLSVMLVTFLVIASARILKFGLASAFTALGLFLLARFWFISQGWVNPDISIAELSLGYRTAITTLLPILMLAAIYFGRHNVRLPRVTKNLTIIFMLMVTLSQGHVTWEWTQYKREFQAYLRENTGFVPEAVTPMAQNPCRIGWTNPTLSVVWSEPVVRTVILSPPNIRWEPYDPLEHRPLSGYVDYELDPLSPP